LQIMDLAILHELLHTIGIVATCAPHHTRAGHVSDSPNDLMWAGVGDWNPTMLDVGRDDYFEANVAGCLDLADSPFLEGNEPQRFRLTLAVRGPGRVTSAPAGISCPRRCATSFQAGTRVVLRAVPARKAVFRGWSGACRGTGRCPVVLSGDRRIGATFRR
jgi:hypothetical protein